jgi:tetratricopeptide (TPR) repeat protein
MKPVKSTAFPSLRLLALVVALTCLPAMADEYNEVSQLVNAGKLAEALTRTEKYLGTQGKDTQMRFLKGVIQRDSGKTSEAIATFTKLTEDHPELPEPYNNLAVLYAGQNQFDKARAALEMAIRTNPSYATAHENLGDIYSKLASQAYNKALQLDTANQAVPPKLALIRKIFSTNASQAQRQVSAPSAAVTSTAPPAKVVSAAPTPVVMSPAVPLAVQASTPPVVIAPKTVTSAPSSKPVSPVTVATQASGQSHEVEAAVAKWAKAWSARDVKSYLASYGKDFEPPGSISRKNWEEERQVRITSKSSITVRVDNLNVRVNGNHATAKFRQSYKAGELAVSSVKSLDFAKVGEHWLIVKETVGN